MGQEILLAFFSNAGNIVEYGSELTLAAQRTVVGDGEAVAFVAHALDEIEGVGLARQDDRFVFVFFEEKLFLLGESEGWNVCIALFTHGAGIRPSEEQKIDELVQYMNENKDSKVVISGYADVKTGNENINLRISEKRAKATAEALKAKGIAEDRIQIEYKGDTEQPFEVNEQNRVAICVTQ